MSETDLAGVEVVAAVPRQGPPLVWFRIDGTSAGSVEGISYEGITCRREVYADLMGAACQDVDFEQRGIFLRGFLEHPAFRVRRSAFGSSSIEIADSGVRDSADGCLYRELFAHGDPTYQCPINFCDAAFAQVLRQGSFCQGCRCEEDDSGRSSSQTMEG